MTALTSAFASEALRDGFITLWPVQSAQGAVQWLAPILERDVVPFLDAHQDIPGLDRLLNSDERQLFDLELDSLYPSVNGIIFAYLAHNPDLPRLIAEYRTQVVPWGEDDLTGYDRLANHLLNQRGLTA